ncbi:hypothetical protein GCM10010919_03100 [Alishewanella longhuensis]|uniref:GNAT family N-acetyltransferase n=1 Tax=Alishewanella longhuensis TaxID=1091037 RepID=A0ABQ3KV29_9ALTE|nr:hypothetical protein GCM10010919_03100 [Alishewanella longhuensis]
MTTMDIRFISTDDAADIADFHLGNKAHLQICSSGRVSGCLLGMRYLKFWAGKNGFLRLDRREGEVNEGTIH